METQLKSVCILCIFQADVALMHDAAKVILDTYSRLLKNKSDIFRNNFRRGEVYNRGMKGIDCQTWPAITWEHGKTTAEFMKQVCVEPSAQ